jgi:hypothetical protein
MRTALIQCVAALQNCIDTYGHDKKMQDEMLAAIKAAEVKLDEPEQKPIGYASIFELERLKDPVVAGRPVFVGKEPAKGQIAIYLTPFDQSAKKMAIMDFLSDQVLMWNRRHEIPPIRVGYELSVAETIIDIVMKQMAP